MLDNLEIVTLKHKDKRWIGSNKDHWKKQQIARHNSVLIHDDSIHDSITNAGHNNISFSQTLHNWTGRHNNSSTSFEDSARNTFDTKLISCTLPTSEILASRHGDKFQGLNCNICNTCPESYEHIWHCPLNLNAIDCVIDFAVWDTNEELFINCNDIEHTVITLLKPVNIPKFLPDLVHGIAISPFVEAIKTTLNSIVGFNKYIRLLRTNLKNYF